MTYRVELVPSDRGYLAACPDLPGCISEGSSESDALQNIRELISERLAGPSADEKKIVRFVEVSAKETTLREPFVVKPLMSQPFPAAWTSGKVEDLLDILEGPDRKW